MHNSKGVVCAPVYALYVLYYFLKLEYLRAAPSVVPFQQSPPVHVIMITTSVVLTSVLDVID